ncbi:MAG: hypothetical protein ACRDSE_02155 [Pseudonocardiaceae bacterium]
MIGHFFANRAAADQALADRDDIAVLDLADAWQLSLRVAEQTPSLAPGTRS